jgi:hypothetical protein
VEETKAPVKGKEGMHDHHRTYLNAVITRRDTKVDPDCKALVELNNNKEFVDFRTRWFKSLTDKELSKSDAKMLNTEIGRLVGKDKRTIAVRSLADMKLEIDLQNTATLVKNIKTMENGAKADEYLDMVMEARDEQKRFNQERYGMDSALGKITKYDMKMIEEGKLRFPGRIRARIFIFHQFLPFTASNYQRLGFKNQTTSEPNSISNPFTVYPLPLHIKEKQQEMLEKFMAKLKNTEQVKEEKKNILLPFVENYEITPRNAQLYFGHIVTRKSNNLLTMSKKKQYLNDFLEYYEMDPTIRIDSFNAVRSRFIIDKDIQELYNELIVYSRTKETVRYTRIALMISLVNYLNLSTVTLSNMMLNSLFHKDSKTNKYFITTY